MSAGGSLARHALRLAWLLLLTVATLQAAFALRIGVMAVIDPGSTAFQRSEAWRLLTTQGRIEWSQTWVDYDAISIHLKRAVIASEDAAFVDHSGVDWEAMERAWERNQAAQARADRRTATQGGGRSNANATPTPVGGSTISQQLAKNLFLSGERTVLRKAQEFVITGLLETLLSKRRMLEIYLNHVEWGEGLFGAQAAARHYHRVDARHLGPEPASRLAVMLPAPKRFEKRPSSAYVAGRAATIQARMGGVRVP